MKVQVGGRRARWRDPVRVSTGTVGHHQPVRAAIIDIAIIDDGDDVQEKVARIATINFDVEEAKRLRGQLDFAITWAEKFLRGEPTS